MKKEYLECGKIVSTHGVAGELKVQPWCDSPSDLEKIKKMYLDDKGKVSIDTVVRPHKNMVLIKVQGITNIEQAQQMRGKILYIHRNDMALEDGEFFIQDILGLTVIDVDTKDVYGKIVDVTQTGANDVYHIEFANGDIKLIPVIDEVIISTDIDAGVITIRPIKGLFDDDN